MGFSLLLAIYSDAIPVYEDRKPMEHSARLAFSEPETFSRDFD
jgi:hypothetical protein